MHLYGVRSEARTGLARLGRATTGNEGVAGTRQGRIPGFFPAFGRRKGGVLKREIFFGTHIANFVYVVSKRMFGRSV